MNTLRLYQVSPVLMPVGFPGITADDAALPSTRPVMKFQQRIAMIKNCNRYPDQVLRVIEGVTKVLNESLDNYIYCRKISNPNPFIDPIKDELAPKLYVSKNAIQCWKNPRDLSGKKMGFGDFVYLCYLINDYSAVNALHKGIEALRGKK